MPRKYMKSLGNPAKAVAYLRVSTEEQHLGPEAQRKQIEAWAKRQEVTVEAWHQDQGVSGAAGINERPGLAAAINDVRVRKAGWLVVAKRDRIARSVEVAIVVGHAVRAGGGRLASADGTPVGDEPSEKLQRGIGDLFAEYERDLIAARTKAALAVKKARGERVGTIPYGFRTAEGGARLEESPEEQRTIAKARELRDRGVTLRGIASMLDLEGFKTRAGTAFTHVQVSKMLGRVPAPKPAEPEPEPQRVSAKLSESFDAWRGR